MVKTYFASIFAQRVSQTRYGWNQQVTHRPIQTNATSLNEAIGLVSRGAFDLFPQSEGWEGHSWNVIEWHTFVPLQENVDWSIFQ